MKIYLSMISSAVCCIISSCTILCSYPRFFLLYSTINTIECTAKVSAQEIGYDTASPCKLCIALNWKNVYIQRILKPHAPKSATIVGRMEYPTPLTA